MLRRTLAGWLLGCIIVGCALLFVIGTAAANNGWNTYLRLMQQGSSCQATITRVEPGNTCRAHYTFSIAGRSYNGTAPICGVKVGQQVAVTYLSDDPSNSCLGSPGARLADEVVSFFFGGFSFPEQP